MHRGTWQWPGQKKLFCFDCFIQHRVQAAYNNNNDHDDDIKNNNDNNNIAIIIFAKRIFRDVLMIQPAIQSETNLIKNNTRGRYILALQEQTRKSTFHMKIQDVTTTGNGERERAQGTRKCRIGTKPRFGNEVTDRVRVRVRLCSYFSFSRSPYWFPAPRSPFQ